MLLVLSSKKILVSYFALHSARIEKKYIMLAIYKSSNSFSINELLFSVLITYNKFDGLINM